MMAVIVVSITVGHSLVSSDGFYNGEAPLKMETIEDAGTNLKGWSIYRWAWRRRWWWRWWWWSDGDGIVLPSSSLCSLRWPAATCWNAHHISETLPNCKIEDDNYKWKHLDRIQARRSIIAPHCVQHTLDLRHLITVTQVSLSSPPSILNMVIFRNFPINSHQFTSWVLLLLCIDATGSQAFRFGLNFSPVAETVTIGMWLHWSKVIFMPHWFPFCSFSSNKNMWTLEGSVNEDWRGCYRILSR